MLINIYISINSLFIWNYFDPLDIKARLQNDSDLTNHESLLDFLILSLNENAAERAEIGVMMKHRFLEETSETK